MTECKVGLGPPNRPRTRYVLTVDRNVTELVYLSMLLQRFSYSCCTTTNSSDAFDMAVTASPALMIIAMELADSSGLELIKRIKRDPRTESVPVIAKLDQITPGLERQFRDAGAAKLLTSPVRAEDLFQAVQNALEVSPRSNIRIRTRLPVKINGKLLDCGKGECISELSEHGIYIRTLEPCPVTSRVQVEIIFGALAVKVEAAVLYCHHTGEGPFKEPGMGLKFISISTEDAKFLRSVINEEIMIGIPRG